jgi:hypothetical protein
LGIADEASTKLISIGSRNMPYVTSVPNEGSSSHL